MQSGPIPIQLLLVLSILYTASFLSSAGGEAGPRCRDDERRALWDIRRGLTDPIGRLSSWVGDDCCAWSGVRCNNKTSHIVALDLHNPYDDYGELGGNIISSLLHLKRLTFLDLSGNDFDGMQIPEFLGSLLRLRHLRLPKMLDLSSNKVDGEISKIIHVGLSGCSRFSLEVLNFGRNQLTGQLSDGLGQFKMLKTLNLDDNMISGSIPSSIGVLSNLRELYFGDNKLNGSVPKTLGQLSNLVVLDLNFNSLTGLLSDAHFANTMGLKALFLSSNSITFVFPSNFVPQFQLTNIHLGSCQLGTRFPAWLQTQHQFSTLDISNVGISDTMPD
ncbi:hypothetical protein Taro_045090 [Colocasia esculenta]|uniref:Leucine-rich repeat-containing N-terminal plant-type domain-containing protein n=1 Tax=Colocasia esculenta TaxID=4460 RepID=A0A843X482_COLES|nr:hypothetical protein [Colocasia esculenta]